MRSVDWIHPDLYWLSRSQPELFGTTDQLRLRADAELPIDVRKVGLHRSLAHDQPRRDPSRGLAARREHRHFCLAAAEGANPDLLTPARTPLATGEEDLYFVHDGVDVAEPGPVV